MTRRERAIPAALALLAFALALAQQPGWASSDTKIDLHVDPSGFLRDVASVWTSSGALGHVQGGQYGGYLFPMGPFFALGHAVGLAPWLVHRLWLGTLLALAAWGTVRLLDDLAGRPRGAAHLVAGVLIVLNPYVVVFTARTSITLLAYAALPWLLLAVHRGVRRPRSWWWPAFFALAVTATGGGVNAAVTAWILLGPALLAVYEGLAGGVRRRDVRAFAWRAAALTLAVSLWWLAPIVTQALYGIDFLQFTEQPGTIWGTTSMSETLRLMGYWVSYIGVGFHGVTRPYFTDSPTLLYTSTVVAAMLVVPALVLGGFAWTRRARYGPFFLALVLLGALVMTAGFPEGTPLRSGLHFAYNNFEPTHFLRTTYKAGPLVALGLAGLGGLGAAILWRRVSARGRGRSVALAAGAAALLVAASWPLASGHALDRQLLWKRIPAAWTGAARDLGRELPRQTRAVVLPGELFAYYRWGATIDPILPALTDRPVAVRNIVPFADQHAIDAFWNVDGLVGQERLVPGQLPPLVRGLGAGAVIANADGDISRSGQPWPARSARTLAAQGYGRPTRAYGATRAQPEATGGLGGPLALPDVRRYDVPDARRIVRVEPLRPAAVVDGSAVALAGLAALGALPAGGSVAYAGDRDAAEVRRAAQAGAEVVISDSNRRRVFIPARLEQNQGWTLQAGERPSQDAAMLNPFAGRSADGQTVSELGGVRSLRAPFSPGTEQFPEHRPFAAFDGNPQTAWLADPALETPRRWIEVTFLAPRDVPYVDVLPESDRFGQVRKLAVAGRTFSVRPGWNRLALGLRGAGSLRIRIADVAYPRRLLAGGAGGLYEVRIPRLHVTEALRPPVLAERALAATDLRHTPISYLFERTTGDQPFRRARFTGPPQALRVADRGDGETGLVRTLHPPAARRFQADAWASTSPTAPDERLDALAGYRGPARFGSASRFEGRPGLRASSAFDGDPATAWIGQWIERAPAWVGWETPRPLTVTRLRMTRPRQVVRFPTRVRVVADGAESPALRVAPDGSVSLPRALRGRRYRVDILSADFPPQATAQERTRRAVGLGSIQVPGLAVARVHRAGPVRGACGDLVARVGGGRLRMRVTGTLSALDAGTPLRAAPCAKPLDLPARRVTLTVADGLFRPYWLRLRSPAPSPLATAAALPGAVTDLGRAGQGRHDGVKVALRAPALLVLGESYNRGWRAWCGERSLGEPKVVDGYANGWTAPAGCRDVRFAFGPQRAVVWAYLLSALAGLALLGLLLLRRPGAETAPAAVRETPPDRQPAGLPLRRAAALGLLVAAAMAFVFALRAGIGLFPIVTFVLWRGLTPRSLALGAGGLLAIEPLLYVLFTPRKLDGGYNFNYAVDLIGGHWVAVAAVVLLGLALWRTLRPPAMR